MYRAEILKDSVSEGGHRLTTLLVEYPHAIHKDIMTHRMFARNFKSFRAFPPEKVIENIQGDPFVPEVFDTRVTGMGQGSEHPDQALARAIWQTHIDQTVLTAKQMIDLPNGGLAKAQVNFVLQDLTWITGIITATHWDNFWALRLAIDHRTGKPFARPEVYKIASLMKEAYDNSEPQTIGTGAWHLPLVTDEEIAKDYPEYDPADRLNWVRHWDFWKKVSTGRCARVSYLTHDGVRDLEKDIQLHDTLLNSGHMSPFEHIATPFKCPPWDPEMGAKWSGPFFGWEQYRKYIPYEDNYGRLVASVLP